MKGKKKSHCGDEKGCIRTADVQTDSNPIKFKPWLQSTSQEAKTANATFPHKHLHCIGPIRSSMVVHYHTGMPFFCYPMPVLRHNRMTKTGREAILFLSTLPSSSFLGRRGNKNSGAEACFRRAVDVSVFQGEN